ncbi:MAG: DNA-binding protein [Elusimicrobia bacterium]|nr:DNA-binding protein [Elusimicrobiota bacterium]
MHKKATIGRLFIGRFEYKDDLLASLNKFCRKNNIFAGIFSLIGAVQNAKLGYYDQKRKRYKNCVSLNKKLEIVSCSGNISLKEKKPFVHAHIALADLRGKTFGGHLMEGTKVFAAEFFIQELTNIKLKRSKDSITGLPLFTPLETA